MIDDDDHDPAAKAAQMANAMIAYFGVGALVVAERQAQLAEDGQRIIWAAIAADIAAR